MTVKDLRTLMFPSMIDPDLEDTPSLVSCDFGMATHFIYGRYPSFKIEPSSNDTDPGLYEVRVFLTDDNPNKQSSITSFNITIDPLPPAILNRSALS
jgi:hypothetical protein